MLSPRSWMWSSLGLAVLVGACLGVIVDRLVLREDSAFADVTPRSEPHWFLCNEQGSLNIEEEPGYLFSEDIRTRILGGLRDELGLRPEQFALLESYLEESRHGAHEFWENSRHAYCDIRDAFRSEIRELLDEQQRVRWEEMLQEVDRRESDYVRQLGARRATSP